MDFDWDCIVVCAGPAGLAAALILGRARRRALVLDSAMPRNRAARAMHGVLGHDGLNRAALRARGVQEVARYRIDVRTAQVDPAAARTVDGGVEVAGERARTLILATGLHGAGVDADDEGALARVGVPVVRERIERLVATDGRLTAIELAGRPPLERDALFFHVGLEPRTALAAALGCALDANGFVVAAKRDRRTTVDRVYAAGNCADPAHNVPMAAADGARAAMHVNVRLVEEGILQP